MDSFLCIPLAALLIYVPHAAKIAAVLAKPTKDGKPGYDLRWPRVSTEAASDATPAGRYIARAQGAHQNGFETFPLLVAGVLMSHVAGGDRQRENLAATAFVIARALYIILYLNNRSVGVATIRSLMWGIQLGAAGLLMWQGISGRNVHAGEFTIMAAAASTSSAAAKLLTFKRVAGSFSILKLAARADIPAWALSGKAGGLTSITRTAEELSIVCPTEVVPQAAPAAAGGGPDIAAAVSATTDAPSGILAHEPGWAALAIDMGVLPFGLTGILLAALQPLSGAGIGIFAVSTYNTDVVLVKEKDYGGAIEALKGAGHTVGE